MGAVPPAGGTRAAPLPLSAELDAEPSGLEELAGDIGAFLADHRGSWGIPGPVQDAARCRITARMHDGPGSATGWPWTCSRACYITTISGTVREEAPRGGMLRGYVEH